MLCVHEAGRLGNRRAQGENVMRGRLRGGVSTPPRRALAVVPVRGVAGSARGIDRPQTGGVVDEFHRHAPLARTAAPRRCCDGRSSLRSANGERPAAIRHSAFSTQHSAFSTQHSALSIQHYPSPASRHPIRRPHAIILRPFGSLPNRSTTQTSPARRC